MPTNVISAARALVSIGTNSTRLLVLAGDRIVAAQSVGTRLGRGLDVQGRLDSATAALTLETIGTYLEVVRRAGATIDVIATSALRRASDAATFCARVAELSGVEPRILSGEQEATYSFLGATAGTAVSGKLGVLDVGGGSTEYALGTASHAVRTVSLEIGAVRLSERFPVLLGERALDVGERARVLAAAREHLAPILAPLTAFERCDELIAVGGTVFTAAGMISGDPARDGVRISAQGRKDVIDALLARDLEARRHLAHIRPQRADILAGGLIIVDTACRLLTVDALRVSHADLLAGYLRSTQYRAVAL